jgi:hypothetical protein
MKKLRPDQVMHIAVQYPAAAAISFNKSCDDDSHTALHWNPDVQSLQIDLKEKGLLFGLSYRKFALEFRKINNSLTDSMELSGKTHNEIITWIRSVLGNGFDMKLHYDLPYEFPLSHFEPDVISNDDLTQLRDKRELAYDSLEAFRMNLNNPSPVHTWPHHFDTAVSEDMGNGRALGFGLATPDSMRNEFYFYAYAFDGASPVEVKSLQEPATGEWVSTDSFKGAVMSSENTSKASVMSFFYSCHKLLSEKLMVS